MTRTVEQRTVVQESGRLGGFRVPAFEIRVAGAGLPGDVVRDVTQVTYRSHIKELDSFELTVNNWDPATNDFKYLGAETASDLESSTPEGLRYRLFEPCNEEVQVWLGYQGNLGLMTRGSFTTLEPSFPSAGAPTLTVRGLNVLHELRRKQYTHAWSDERDSDIALGIARLEDPQTRRNRFPLPIRISEDARSDEDPIPYVTQKNQYDIDFLVQRARLRGYVVYVDEDEEGRFLYFGPSRSGVSARLSYELHWGRSLVDFKPTLSTTDQVRSITVEGWNRRTNERISETVDLDDPALEVNRDLHRLLEQCNPREETVTDKPVSSPREARNLALNLLREQVKGIVEADGTVVGLPELRAGAEARVLGVGSRLSGTYFITEATHTHGDNGYTTRFKARREQALGEEAS